MVGKIFIITTVTIIFIILLILGSYLFTPRVVAFIYKFWVDDVMHHSISKNYGEIKERIKSIEDIEYDSDVKNSIMDIYTPFTYTRPLPIIMWIHGGGYIFGDKSVTAEYGRNLANKGYLVANINYSLAPGHKYPEPIIQANQALKYLNEHAPEYGGDTNKFFIGGDSAGAQIASQITALQTDTKLSSAMHIIPALKMDQLKGSVLFCGLYDMDTLKNSVFPGLSMFFWSYTGVKDYMKFKDIDELSATKQVIRNYPPTFISVGGSDSLSAQSKKFASVLANNNIPVTSVFFSSENTLGHEYQFNLDEPDAINTFKKAVDFLNQQSK